MQIARLGLGVLPIGPLKHRNPAVLARLHHPVRVMADIIAAVVQISSSNP